jgi:hypothetical protein
VKGIEKKYDWPADNIRKPKRGKLFIFLVSYEGKIEDPTFTPNMWIIPFGKIKSFEK